MTKILCRLTELDNVISINHPLGDLHVGGGVNKFVSDKFNSLPNLGQWCDNTIKYKPANIKNVIYHGDFKCGRQISAFQKSY